jgi:hypothetical protein
MLTSMKEGDRANSQFYFLNPAVNNLSIFFLVNHGQLLTNNPGLAALAANLKIAKVPEREEDDRLDEVADNFDLCRHL